MTTGAIEQSTTSQRPSDRIYAEVEELRRQLDELPGKIKAHRDLANESLDDKVIVESLQVAQRLEHETLPALRLRLWHREKDYLQAHKADLLMLEVNLRDCEVAKAKGDFDQTQAILDAAKIEMAKAQQRLNAIGGQQRGVDMELKEVERQIQKHENSKPTV